MASLGLSFPPDGYLSSQRRDLCLFIQLRLYPKELTLITIATTRINALFITRDFAILTLVQSTQQPPQLGVTTW